MPDPAATVGILAETIETLERHYQPPPLPDDPFALIVWENIGYLISDDRRRALFDELVRRIGLEPASLADAPEAVLLDIASRGGMGPTERVSRLRHIGRLALEAGGDLASALRAGGPVGARSLLKRFPGIGDPGADKIILFCGLESRPALESNGLRVLVRLGHADEGAAYAQTYRSGISALTRMTAPDRHLLIDAYRLLRAHGQALCKRSAPLCIACPLDSVCAHATTKNL